ncbi:class I SAM-dependent RNA methyltransferase [Gluconobacter cerinus]|uniref:THUMP domain-containing class I SAM-dependent RNA methyltransferase n=1 Tax=Gluconobacter cerinus TaxID=38307 RepID=UPI001B8BF629|nr:THUMP domain-containing protein [Gluconobacter cerinus]MBS1031176.1 class I SAM-dependent RNA methyltransferase [Gluconobacter cerinus]
MTNNRHFEIFLAAPPGLEETLCSEVQMKGFRQPKVVPGGVTLRGGWPEVWRANLWIRGASRVLARVAQFKAEYLSQLEKRAREVKWAEFLRPDVPFKVEVSCSSSRIYHSGAAAERISKIVTELLGAPAEDNADVVLRVRIDQNFCTISVDTSGDLLHRRGHKEAVNRAPMRETLASLFLRKCGYNGQETVLDPMCGSGTFVIEAAEIASRLNPGRSRHFAFEQLATYDEDAWQTMRSVKSERTPEFHFYGSDRDAGAITMSEANALRAGVTACTEFRQATISEIMPPEGSSPGLVILNPPYGTRIGDKTKLSALYRALGNRLLEQFKGWRVGILTTEVSLAHATGLPFLPTGAPIPHGGLKVFLFQTEALS